MNQTDFTERLNDLADFYQKDLKPVALQQWYKEFGWLAPFQLDILAREAKRDCDRFPAGKYFWDQIRGHSFTRPEIEGRQEPQIATVICKCGESFAVERSVLEQPGAYFPLFDSKISGPKKGCLNCNAMYSGEFILRVMKDSIAQMR